MSPTSAQSQAELHDSECCTHAVAAVVDGHTIWESEVEKSAVRRYGQEILESLIDNYLMKREADRLHVAVSETEIDHQVQALIEAIKPKTLEEGLKQHHQTLVELRDDFRQRLLSLKLAAIGTPPGHFVHAHVILSKSSGNNPAAGMDVEELAPVAELQRKIEAGANFEELASQYSQDLSSQTRGGDAGILFEGSAYDSRVIEAALQLQAGQIMDQPIKTPAGYYLVKAVSTDSEHSADEDMLYAEAQWQYKLRQGSQNLSNYMHALRMRASIKSYADR